MKIAFLLVGIVSLLSCGNYGDGMRVGTVIKFAKQGVFCSTWEGEMVRGGMNNGSGSFSAPFDFTVEDPDLVEKVRFALENQVEIKTHYHEELNSFCRSDSSSHFLTQVDILHQVGKAPTQASTQKEEKAIILQQQIDELQDEKARLQ